MNSGQTVLGTVSIGENHDFVIGLPSSVAVLTVTLSGTDDADLYVKHGSPISGAELGGPHDEPSFRAPFAPGSEETVQFTEPAAGTWYVTVRGFAPISDYSIVATWIVVPTGPPEELSAGQVVSGTVVEAESHNYVIELPDADTLTLSLSGTGDADLYVKNGSQISSDELGQSHDGPTFQAIYASGSEETVQFNGPPAGTWYVTVHGYAQTSDYSLVALWSAEPPVVAIPVGETVQAVIGAPGEVDGFIFEAQAGFMYVIETTLGTLRDSIITLSDSSGQKLGFSDDFAGLASRIEHTATTSDTLHVEVRGFLSSDTGTYSLTLLRSGRATVVISYSGTEIVLVGTELNEAGPSAVLHLDIDGDGAFEEDVNTDASGLYTLSFDAGRLSSDGNFEVFSSSANGSFSSEVRTITAIQETSTDLADSVPSNVVSVEPAICACGNTRFPRFTKTYTPVVFGTELASGELRQTFPITGFSTRMLGFYLGLSYASLTDYNGYAGLNFSHSYNTMIVQTGDRTGRIITPDLRIFPIDSSDGVNWALPSGFFSRLRLDPALNRWVLTHHQGLEIIFYQGLLDYPGYPISYSEPNGNSTRLEYDNSGLLQRVITDLDQVQTLGYGQDQRLRSFTDHIGRTWTFEHDALGRLTAIASPEAEFAIVAAGMEVTDDNLDNVMTSAPRVTTLEFAHPDLPSLLTAVVDPRGARPISWAYGPEGRVGAAWVNDNLVSYIYSDEGLAFPAPLPTLDPGNIVTRVIDREVNFTDYEIHSDSGGAIQGKGRFGLRRRVTWTASGQGLRPLRADEPRYWEQRWLHDCDCLAPAIVARPFSSADALGLAFDLDGIPNNWPRQLFTYNSNRQITFHEYTDGMESIFNRSNYQQLGFGDDGQFSRLLGRTDPRAFDDNLLYQGVDFVHNYSYDEFGNLIRRDSPTVTLGVNGAQPIVESWNYNAFGQPLTHTDPNGNVTARSYFLGPSSGGDVNTKGEFGGYMASMTFGAPDSSDSVTNLTTSYNVNALGMTTGLTDPKGFVYDYQYNDLLEPVRQLDPSVTLLGGAHVRYEARFIYDGAGNVLMSRRSNIDVDGGVLRNEFVDESRAYDAVNNMISSRVEVDHFSANDLITRYAYDLNDDLAVVQRPEGNREFFIYDERRLLYGNFYGIALGAAVSEGYPVDKRADELGNTSFVGLTIRTYDARGNLTRTRDGRGNYIDRFYDFYDRQIAESDQNGNGGRLEYDDASHVLTSLGGQVSKTTGAIIELLKRSYGRFDEVGRRYQYVLDIDLATDETLELNPKGSDNLSYQTVFDPGSRAVAKFDANGNPTLFAFDAADRMLTVTDALDNVLSSEYDRNSNILSVTAIENPGPGATGLSERYVATYAYDELDRPIAGRVLGLNGNSIDHYTFSGYDSRHNVRLIQDAKDNFTLKTFDDLDREIVFQRFDADPLSTVPNELLRYEFAYDRNSNKIEDRALLDVSDPSSVQLTRHAYDELDRPIRKVYPDSDDPIDGSGNGQDGVYDRIETIYDENSNPVTVTEQRGVAFVNFFDPGNRIVEQEIEAPLSVPGTTGQEFFYDALNRITSLRNDYARVDRQFDPLSRVVVDEQSIRLDGNGFVSGWDQPVSVSNTYDNQSNRLSYTVEESLTFGRLTSLFVRVDFDPLNRQDTILAEYFETPSHLVADYSYFGPRRVQTTALGNGAVLTNTFDVKQRIESLQWNGPSGTLVGFGVEYDRVDNAKSERFDHDGGLYDHFAHNDRYELTGVEYRSAILSPPTIPNNTFDYDDLFNRTLASFGGPFDGAPVNEDAYVVNAANEFVQLSRNGSPTDPEYDLAGDLTRIQVRPVTSTGVGDVAATTRWDPTNNLFDIETGVNLKQHYRYDPLGRRIASFELSGLDIEGGSRRYIYSGSTVVEERVFGPFATLSSAPSVTERIYVNGSGINEPLLAAIDGDGDGKIGAAGVKNQPISGIDQEYYLLSDHRGNVMALLDADDSDRVLEYYRYEVFGEATVLPIVDADEDGFEDTPFDLTDNNADILLEREFEPTAGRKSDFGNPYLFAARRFDWQTGLYLFGCRYYEATSARFIQRGSGAVSDCAGNMGNAYAVEANNPVGPDGIEDFDQEEGGCSLPGPGGGGPGGYGPCGDCSGLSCKGLAPGPHAVLCPGGTAICIFNCPIPDELPCALKYGEDIPQPVGNPLLEASKEGGWNALWEGMQTLFGRDRLPSNRKEWKPVRNETLTAAASAYAKLPGGILGERLKNKYLPGINFQMPGDQATDRENPGFDFSLDGGDPAVVGGAAAFALPCTGAYLYEQWRKEGKVEFDFGQLSGEYTREGTYKGSAQLGRFEANFASGDQYSASYSWGRDSPGRLGRFKLDLSYDRQAATRHNRHSAFDRRQERMGAGLTWGKTW